MSRGRAPAIAPAGPGAAGAPGSRSVPIGRTAAPGLAHRARARRAREVAHTMIAKNGSHSRTRATMRSRAVARRARVRPAKIAVAPVVAVEETTLLMTMQRVVGLGRLPVRLERPRSPPRRHTACCERSCRSARQPHHCMAREVDGVARGADGVVGVHAMRTTSARRAVRYAAHWSISRRRLSSRSDRA